MNSVPELDFHMQCTLGSEWQLPSNSGRSAIAGLLIGILDGAEDQILRFNVKCHCVVFDRYGEGGFVDDYDMSLHQVAISQAKLSQGITELTEWLRAPKEVVVDFSVTPEQTFTISLKVQADVISSLNKPVCWLRYESFLIKYEMGFIVDQSCIRIFRDSLAAFFVRPMT